MKKNADLMYVYVIAYTKIDDDFTYVHTIRVYCDKPSMTCIHFMVDEETMEEIPKEGWQDILDHLYHFDNWTLSYAVQAVVDKRVLKRRIKYYDIYGKLMHTELKEEVL